MKLLRCMCSCFAAISWISLYSAHGQAIIVKWTRVVNNAPQPEETVQISPAPTSGQPFMIQLPFQVGPGGTGDTPAEYVGAIRIYTTITRTALQRNLITQ